MKRFAALFGMVFCPALLASDPVGVSFETSTYSQYVWRGLLVTNGPVQQTSSTVSYRGSHFNVFTNTDLVSANQRRGRVSELDYDAGYDKAIEKATLSGGFIHYTFPNTPFASTTELYGGAALDAPLHPSARIFVDIGAIEGAYVTVDFAHARTLLKPRPNLIWSAEMTAGVGVGTGGYNRGYFGVPHSGVVDVHPAITAPLRIGTHVRITPRLGYGSLLDAALRRCEVAKVHGFYYGISISATF